MYTREQVIEHIQQLMDPSVNKTFKETGGLKHVGIDEETNVVTLIIGLENIGDEFKKQVTRSLAKLIK